MSLWLDKKYINLAASQLPRFVWKSQVMANFRCILCGDSQTRQTKARAYLYPFKNTGYMMKCHNCSTALPFGAFLKRVSLPLYEEYRLEDFNSRFTPPPTVILPEPPVIKIPAASYTTYLTPAAECFPVASYIRSRKLPESSLTRLFATTHAQTWATPLVGPDKAKSVTDGHPYLVLPLTLPDGVWYGAQLRPVDRKEYLTFRWAHEHLRVFGLDHWNPEVQTFCVEGPLDALCLPNALAFCGADLQQGLDRLLEAGYDVPRRVLVWDNEPKNAQIASLLKRAIADTESVVIWPKGLPKDCNDMVAQHLDVEHLASTHIYKGLRAELEYAQWHN